MRLATVRIPDKEGARPVAAAGGGVLDLSERCGFASLKAVFGDGERGLSEVKDAIAKAGPADFVPTVQVTFLPPIPDPSKFLCVGKNYRQYLDELVRRQEVKSGTRFWTVKNMPGFGPIGPYIVTMDEFADVDDLWLTCTVNGSLRSRFNTSGLIFKIPDIIEHFSRYLPLETCDQFATGSAGGIAAAQENADKLFFFKAGGRYRCGDRRGNVAAN